MADNEIVLSYLNGKSSEEEIISFLKEQKNKLLQIESIFEEGYVSLLARLIEESSGRVKYNAVVLLANLKFYVKSKDFQDACKIISANSGDNDGNIRQACFNCVKAANAWMIAYPFINAMKPSGREDVNLFYESFRDLFYALVALFESKDAKVKKSIMRSLDVMLPRILDMAEFQGDKKEIARIAKIRNEVNKGLIRQLV